MLNLQLRRSRLRFIALSPISYTFLSYAGPPIIGAFIGYLTNRIAIRMLFRPLKPWHFAGLRVPMTPGVIPSKRHVLAENIGEMVGQHLLTGKDIGAALSEEPFQDHLYGIVDSRLREVLNRDLGPVITVIPRRFKAYFKIGVRTLKYQLREGVHRYLASDAFAETITASVIGQLNSLGTRELNDLVSVKERQAFYLFIDDLVSDLLHGQKVEVWLSDYLARHFKAAAQEGKSVSDQLPDSFIELILDTIRNQSPRILRMLAGMLSEPAVRDRIIYAVKGGVDHFIDSLGPVGAMARGFLDMDSLEAKIREYLIDKEDDFIDWLQTPELQERFADVLVEQTEKFFQKPLSVYLNQLDEDRFNRICRESAVQLLGVLRSEGMMATLSAMLRENFEQVLEQGKRQVGDIAEQFFPGEASVTLQDSIARESVAMLRTEKVTVLLDRILNSFVDAMVAKPVGILHNLMPSGVRKGITDYIVLTANRMLLKEVPGLVDSLNIR
ncbi:MAG: DUF445 family protein, partial [Desulfobulbaceae bacterium]|nr:DUF445 family protein [Desulfobulbaceae bacterium]